MNHNSGFIIGIVRKLCKNSNRALTKSIFKITLIGETAQQVTLENAVNIYLVVIKCILRT